jgi:hypothetical protein
VSDSDYIISVIRARAGDEFADSVVPALVFVDMMTVLTDLEAQLHALARSTAGASSGRATLCSLDGRHGERRRQAAVYAVAGKA